MKPKVLHIITGLEVGGAERLLRDLVASQRNYATPYVVSLSEIGTIGTDITELDVDVMALGIRSATDLPSRTWRLIRYVRRLRPAVVHTWLSHANVLGGVVCALTRSSPVVWSIHHTPWDRRRGPISEPTIFRLLAPLSRVLPDRIVAVSQSAIDAFVGRGLDSRKFALIPNGIDTELFVRDPESYRSLREEIGAAEDAPVVGMVARYHPQKDYKTFIRAAISILDSRPNVHFVCCGEGVTSGNLEVSSLIPAQHRDRVHLIGVRSDIPGVTAGLDIACLSSAFGESCPLTLLEAMSCGVPCVATDVGDSARILGESGRIVEPGDPEGLARAISELLDLSPQARESLGSAGRRGVVADYSLARCARRYRELYETLLRSPAQ